MPVCKNLRPVGKHRQMRKKYFLLSMFNVFLKSTFLLDGCDVNHYF